MSNRFYYESPAYEGYLQLSHQTAENRFPKIFNRAKEIKPNPSRILSFGCSTGQECFALAEIYPESEIVGVDIDYHSVSQARRNNNHKGRVHFHTCLGATGKYDLITALMVLFSLESPVPKERWIEAVKTIDERLNKDGLFVMYTSDYSFEEFTEVSDKYTVVKSWRRIHPKNRNKYWCGYYLKK